MKHTRNKLRRHVAKETKDYPQLGKWNYLAIDKIETEADLHAYVRDCLGGGYPEDVTDEDVQNFLEALK
jgi:hypothetical protein